MSLKRVKSHMTGTFTSQHKNPVTILTSGVLRKQFLQDVISRIHFCITFSYRSKKTPWVLLGGELVLPTSERVS